MHAAIQADFDDVLDDGVGAGTIDFIWRGHVVRHGVRDSLWFNGGDGFDLGRCAGIIQGYIMKRISPACLGKFLRDCADEFK